MAIVRSIHSGTHYLFDPYRQVTLEEYVAHLRAGGARVELFDAPRKVYGGASSGDIEAAGYEYTFEGAVLATGEKNYHDDSDFYAIVWDDAKGAIRSVYYDTTRGAGGGNAGIDATDEVKAKANTYLEQWAYERLVAADHEEAAKVVKGRRVRVKKGRSAPLGVEGVVFWIGSPKYFSRSPYAPASVRIGIATSERKENGKYADVIWSYAHNVEVLEPEQYHTAEAALRERAKGIHGSWRAIEGYYSARAGMLVA